MRRRKDQGRGFGGGGAPPLAMMRLGEYGYVIGDLHLE
jgi:hypothetical protein